ncbi:U-box domain-containing protein 21 [Ziziphus jujuba]|uniref:U-box domain-containing protein n=2 Tax=Ziziphus jujuba TaxID=326968 RepID=A0A6P3ZWX3_ZIZJJ|nr:U-box domain-containing protein 21 [Ziziphus jujuba]KAH7533985.1 hypothetical protein FEM48_Zijuj04G0189800 [Ziziphus jujuba var. spinosa]
MILSWRRRRAGRRANKNSVNDDIDGTEMEITIPTHFRCPISLDLMKDPVTLSTGITYDRDSIEKWIESGNQTCPVTNQVLSSFDEIPNHTIRRMIQDWCVENGSRGVERIPTPRIPVAPRQVLEVCERIGMATRRGDGVKCQELVGKIKAWGKDSERNKRCMAENGTGYSLCATFEAFSSSSSTEKHVSLLEQIVSVLPWMFPLGVEGQALLGSSSSLNCIVGLLRGKDLSARQNSVLVLKELLSLDQRFVNSLAEIEGGLEALVGIIKEPICPSATKAALTSIFYMISQSKTCEKTRLRLVEMGLVSLLLDNIVDGEKGVCERALGVFDEICNCKEGREKAYENALTMPLLVKKILRISQTSSEFLVSVLWKLCKNEKRNDEGSVLVEALQLGAFQKLLVLLQVGCDERIKEKVTELLKLFNLHRGRLDCSDSSMDFKYLKRPF